MLGDALDRLDGDRYELAWLRLAVLAVDSVPTEVPRVAEAEIVPFRPDTLGRIEADIGVTVEKSVEFDGALGPGRDHVDFAPPDAVPVKDADGLEREDVRPAVAEPVKLADGESVPLTAAPLAVADVV